jgi:hypothetical protein
MKHNSKAVQDVLAERHRQISSEGWTLEHDDKYCKDELADAAVCYACCEGGRAPGYPPMMWPWSVDWWKPKDRRSNLIRATALLIAELERLDRQEESLK